MWRTSNWPKKNRKRYLEIASERDWEWCNPGNRRVITAKKRKFLIGPWDPCGGPYITETVVAKGLKATFIWISLVVERLNIQEDIPRGVFEEICLFI